MAKIEKERKRQKMLSWIWREKKSYLMLVQVQIATATIKTSVEVSFIAFPQYPANTILKNIHKGLYIRRHPSKFIAAVFTVARK